MRKKTMALRLLALFLAAIMAFPAAAAPAFAAEGDVAMVEKAGGDTSYFTTLQDAFDFIDGFNGKSFTVERGEVGGTWTVTLLADCDRAELSATSGYLGSALDVTLDLNGHSVISSDAAKSVLSVAVGNATYPSTFTVTDSSAEKNGKITGGNCGIMFSGANATLNFNGGTITGNHGGSVGGGICVSATSTQPLVNLNGGVITGNSVTGSGTANTGLGGGVYACQITLNGTVITGNYAYAGSHAQTGRGGGIATPINGTADYNVVKINTDTVYDNHADNAGDDLMIQKNGNYRVKHTLVIGTANWYIDGWNGTSGLNGAGETDRYSEEAPVAYTDGGFEQVTNISLGLKYVAGSDTPDPTDPTDPTDPSEPSAPTYTVTYTDGVEAEEVFADQVYTVKEGEATPAFQGTPAREGYVFAGWTPEVAGTVTADAVYTAAWACDHAWTDATCTAPKTCAKCGETEGEALGHKDENSDYRCDVCGEKLCTEHIEVTVPGKAATCTEAGLTEGKKCDLCGEILVAQEEIPALGHTEETVPGKAATCTEAGLTEGKKCDLCGEILVAQEEIPALGHTEETVPGKAATCTETGLTEGKKCSVCGEVLVPQEEIPAKGHAFENGKCTVCGETDPNYVAPVEPVLSGVIRIAGADRIETSLKLAQQLQEVLDVPKFDAVVVASALNFPDALTGSYLAAEKKAPILLTYPAAHERIIAYIEANLKDGGIVYILGGESAVDKDFEDLATAKGMKVQRVAGSDRFGTNLAILEEAGVAENQPVLIATATGFADSLSASATGLPMLLVYSKLTEAQKAFLATTSKEFIIIGGDAAVSADLEAELDAIGDVERVAGENRYQTSVKVADRFLDAPEAAVLAYARNFPDGLCGGPLAYALGAPLILTDNYDPSEADTYVRGISAGIVVGGTGLISDAAARAIFDLAANTEITPK